MSRFPEATANLLYPSQYIPHPRDSIPDFVTVEYPVQLSGSDEESEFIACSTLEQHTDYLNRCD